MMSKSTPTASNLPRAAFAWTRRAVAGALALGAISVMTMAGCPDNKCFLKVCTGDDCRCSISSCSDGAAYDTAQDRCRCLKGYISIAGQCLTQTAANEYCGVGYHWGGTGCVESQCKPGDQLDHSTGWCVPKADVAKNTGVEVGANEEVGCPPGTKLVVEGQNAACVPLEQTCAPDETWNGQACQKVATCPTGSQYDTALGQCVAYSKGGGDEHTVDVLQWAQTNYGPNGGQGTTAFCSTFAKKPWAFGITPGNTAVVRVTVTLAFPDQNIADGATQAATVFDVSGNPVPAQGNEKVGQGAQSIFAPLKAGGGRASSPQASTTVRCAVVNSAPPQAVPASGGV